MWLTAVLEQSCFSVSFDRLTLLSSFIIAASLLETPCPFSPGTSPEPTSPVIPTATPETMCPISQASQSQSVVSVKPLTSNAESFSSRTGSVPGVESLTTWPADPPTLTSHCSSPCPPDHTCITERSTSSTQSVTEFFTSPAAAFTVMADTTKLGASAGCTQESAATEPSRPLSLDSTTAQGASEDISGPMCDTGHVPDQDLLKSLAELAQRGDDAHLPQYLHQVTTVMCKSGMKSNHLLCFTDMAPCPLRPGRLSSINMTAHVCVVGFAACCTNVT